MSTIGEFLLLHTRSIICVVVSQPSTAKIISKDSPGLWCIAIKSSTASSHSRVSVLVTALDTETGRWTLHFGHARHAEGSLYSFNLRVYASCIVCVSLTLPGQPTCRSNMFVCCRRTFKNFHVLTFGQSFTFFPFPPNCISSTSTMDSSEIERFAQRKYHFKVGA